MITALPSLSKNTRGWIWFFTKIAIGLVVFYFLMITVLFNLGGSSELLRDVVKIYLQDATGRQVYVEKLNEMTFYPQIGFDFEGLEIYDTPFDPNTETQTPTEEETEERTKPEGNVVLSIGRVQLFTNFMDIILGTGNFSTLRIIDFKKEPGYLFGPPVHIQEASIKPRTNDKNAALTLTGTMGDQPLNGKITLAEKAYKAYSMADNAQINITLGPLSVSGQLVIKNNQRVYENIALKFENQNFVTGTLSPKSGSGKLTFSEHGTELTPALAINWGKPVNISGTINSSTLNISDFKERAKTRKAISFITNMLDTYDDGPEKYDFKNILADIDITIDSLKAANTQLAKDVKANFNISDNKATLEPKGTLYGGTLNGNVTLDASQSPSNLDINITINDLSYTALRENMEGKGTLTLNATSSGESTKALQQNMNGNFAFISGKGRLDSGFINLWGGGLVNTMLPDLSGDDPLQTNCGIADFSIENGIARSNALFLDTERLTVAGEGTYNISDDNLDIKLKPKSKGIALGTVQESVVLSGSIASPNISPAILDLGAKIGTLVLGTINPAFLVFSLTDLGLTEDHPCSAYIKGEEE